MKVGIIGDTFEMEIDSVWFNIDDCIFMNGVMLEVTREVKLWRMWWNRQRFFKWLRWSVAYKYRVKVL